MGRDLRSYAQQTNIRLLLGLFSVLVFVGGGLIYYFYGPSAAIMAVICLIAAVVPMVMIWLVFVLLEAGIKRNRS